MGTLVITWASQRFYISWHLLLAQERQNLNFDVQFVLNRHHFHTIKSKRWIKPTYARNPSVLFVKCDFKTERDLRCFEGFKKPIWEGQDSIFATNLLDKTENQSRGLDSIHQRPTVRGLPQPHRAALGSGGTLGDEAQWGEIRAAGARPGGKFASCPFYFPAIMRWWCSHILTSISSMNCHRPKGTGTGDHPSKSQTL